MENTKLLICQALDERDFLRKKIFNAIDDAKFVSAKRVRDEKVAGKYAVDEFKTNASADFQRIGDMIKRYHSIDRAITLSNATTMIEISTGDKMTVAEAIALRKNLKNTGSSSTDFTGMLLAKMTLDYNSAMRSLAEYNMKADAQAEAQKMTLLGKDTKKELEEADLNAIKVFTDPMRGELIDPIDIETKIKAQKEAYDTLVKELETSIKVSNATTYIEF